MKKSKGEIKMEELVILKLKESEIQNIQLALLESILKASKQDDRKKEQELRLTLQSIFVALRYQENRGKMYERKI